ncbi:MAG: hypothetical protein H0U60_01205 [Blastocatellia bacterium]|nr:hypothetical protein [Blastocatellia bacterium]
MIDGNEQNRDERSRAKNSAQALRCRRKFLRFFPGGFRDETYIDWERGYKWTAHEQWNEALSRNKFRDLLKQREFAEIAARGQSALSRERTCFSLLKKWHCATQ